MHVLGRLKPGVTAEQARAGLQPWFKSMLEEEMRAEGFPKVSAELRQNFLTSSIDVLPAARGLSDLRDPLQRPLGVLFAGTLLLVLLASLNVAGLLLARGAARGRELTTRMALGASRGRITSQLLVESLLITLAGGWLGLLMAPAVSRVLLSFLSQDVDLTTGIDWRIFLFAFLVSVVSGMICGFAPALQARSRSLIEAIKKQSAVGTRGGVRVRKTIVAAQMAFALVLLIGAGLFVQTLARLYAKDRGFTSSSLLMFRVEPDSIGYSPSEAPQVMANLLHRLHGVPGVERAAIANASLLTGGSARRFLTIQADRRIVTERALPIMRVSPGFFATLGTPVIAGREFNEADTRDLEKTGYRSIVVNESFARRYFGGRSPVGHFVGIGNQPDTATTIEIVGMVKDFTFRFVRDDREPEHLFFPFAEAGPLAGNGTFYVKVRGAPDSVSGSIRAAVGEVDARLPVALRTGDEQIDRSLRSERMLATLSSAFGAIALLLSVVGLYGVMSFVVTRRAQEIGLRLALGATRRAAVWLVIRDALIMIGAGTAVGLPAAWALRRLVQAQLYGVAAFDAPTIVFASGLLALVAVGAAMLPAWRAASISPSDALRVE
jgi:predicted permease